MKCINKIAILLIQVITVCFFASCSDNKSPEIPPAQAEFIDGKAYLQQSLVALDEAGNFKKRVLGEPLNSADTTLLYVGVENIEEAKSIYRRLFPRYSSQKEDGNKCIATLTDQNGNAQGTVTFLPVDDEGEGEVATVSFDGFSLKGVSSLYFILNSAWPQNAVSPYRKGERVVRSTLLDGMQEWICLTEAKLGKQGILYHISKESIDYNSYINTYASQNEHSREETDWIAAELKDAGIYGKFWCGDRYVYSDEGPYDCYSCPAFFVADMTASVLECEFFFVDNGIVAYEDAKVGDFMQQNGNLVEGSLNPGKCIAVVCWVGNPTDKDAVLQKEKPHCTHGLALALQDMEGGEMIFCNDPIRFDARNEEGGYGNTRKYAEYNRGNPVNKVIPVEALGKMHPSAPSQTSGWYLPSDLEFVDIFNVWKKLEPQLKEAGGIPLRNAAYWTSTEQYYYDPQMLVFDWDSYRIDVGLKMHMGYRVRAMLAF